MNKIFRVSLIALLLLGLSSVCFAAGIPLAVSPKTSPEVWTQEVYNNSASALTSGTVVVWDYAGDTTDADFAYRTAWVQKSAASADLITVAGVVVDSSIPAYTEGTIAIRGPVYALCSDSGDAVAALDEVGTSATAAGTAGHLSSASGGATLGWALSSSAVAVEHGGYGGSAASDYVMIPIFVNISILPGA